MPSNVSSAKKSEPRDKASQCMLLRASSRHQCVLPDRHKGSPSSQSLLYNNRSSSSLPSFKMEISTLVSKYEGFDICFAFHISLPVVIIILATIMKTIIVIIMIMTIVIVIILAIIMMTRDANLVDIQECATMPRLAALSYLPAGRHPNPNTNTFHSLNI